jgi:hypothetical protein
MPHYHIKVSDAARGGFAPSTLPKVTPPKAAPAKPPKAPTAKPPTLPKPGGSAGGGKPLGAATHVASGLGEAAWRGAGLARAGERGINRLSAFGEEFNRDDSGRDEMGHYHFNIPSRGSRMSQDYGTSEGARKRGQGVTRAEVEQRNSMGSHANQAAYHKKQAAAHSQAGRNTASRAHNTAYQAHSQAWRNPSPGNSAHAWGATRNTKQFGDSGTSEGARKAAATRSGRGHAVTGGAATGKFKPYGVDIKAGSNTRQAPKPDPEPFRGYDSRRK